MTAAYNKQLPLSCTRLGLAFASRAAMLSAPGAAYAVYFAGRRAFPMVPMPMVPSARRRKNRCVSGRREKGNRRDWAYWWWWW